MKKHHSISLDRLKACVSSNGISGDNYFFFLGRRDLHRDRVPLNIRIQNMVSIRPATAPPSNPAMYSMLSVFVIAPTFKGFDVA